MLKKLPRSPSRWLSLVVVCFTVLVVNIDNTILNVALPTLVRELHANISELQWIVDSYAMVFAGLLLVSGSLADRYGRKKFFLIGLLVFILGSLGAASSTTVHTLIAFRALMGLGSALTVPASLSILNDVFRNPKERAKAIGFWGGTAGLGIALGPIAGGLLLSHFWWGSIFIVNVPIGLVAMLAAVFLVPDSKNPKAERTDIIGALLSVAGLGLLLWAIIEAPLKGWSSDLVREVGLSSLVALTGFVLWEIHSRHPILKIKFFANARFSIATIAEVLGLFGLAGGLFMQTQFLQFDLGYSPLQAGIRILPIAAVVCLIAPLSPICARLIGVKLTVAAGLSAISGGLLQVSLSSDVTAVYTTVLPGLLLIGFGSGLLLPTATNSVISSVPQGDSGVGSATNSVAFQLGGAIGVAVIGSILSTRYQNHISLALKGTQIPISVLHTISGSLGGALTVASSIGGMSGHLLAYAAKEAFMSGGKLSLGVAAAVAFCGAIIVLAFLPSRQPADHSHSE